MRGRVRSETRCRTETGGPHLKLIFLLTLPAKLVVVLAEETDAIVILLLVVVREYRHLRLPHG